MHRICLIILIKLCLWTIATLSAQEAVIDLPGPLIRAGDLVDTVPAFAAVDAETALGAAPRPGLSRRVPRGILLRWAARLGLSLEEEEAPSSLLLRRRLRRLSADEAREILERAVAAALDRPVGEIRVEFRDPMEPLIPDTPLEYALGSRIPALNKPARLRLTWREPGGQSGQQLFDATVRARGSHLIAKRALPARKALSASDFEVVEDWLPGHRTSRLLVNVQQVRGKALRREMKLGEALSEDLLVESPAIMRGSLVELRLAAGAVRLRTSARAEASGSPGELIAFRNLSTGQRVLAYVVDAKAAEVRRP